jgi:hypothetical protein
VAINGAYVVQPNDSYIGAVTGPLTIALQPGITNQKIVIKDESGNAGTNNITISASSPNLIDGSASLTINTNYGVVTLYFNTNWFKI